MRRTTIRDVLVVIENSKSNPKKTGFDFQHYLTQAGIISQESTIRKRFLEDEIKAIRLQKKHIVAAAMKNKIYL